MGRGHLIQLALCPDFKSVRSSFRDQAPNAHYGPRTHIMDPEAVPVKPSDYADLLAHANRLARPLQERLAFLRQTLEREQA